MFPLYRPDIVGTVISNAAADNRTIIIRNGYTITPLKLTINHLDTGCNQTAVLFPIRPAGSGVHG